MAPVASLPTIPLQHTLRDAVPELVVDWNGAPAPEPAIAMFNDRLAAELGLDALGDVAAAPVLAGSVAPAGAQPVAMAYAGHQFGSYNPRLGDGRALLLGELVAPDGRRFDLHLKGSGRTPFARGGDGRAALGAMLREYVIAEAMHALAVPTTRSLAVVTTGEQVHRDGDTTGAVLARVAASHLRVGTFEYAARLGDRTDDNGVLRRLADYAIERHHPAAADAERPYLALVEAVAEAQAALIAKWMLVGFIHGVMNTDNMTISGETIDYGPCAFIDAYDPDTVFSSIDHGGRYRYARQPVIAQWNLARLAESLLPLMEDDLDASLVDAREIIDGFPDRYQTHWRHGMASKLGLAVTVDGDAELFDDLLATMKSASLDYTSTFRRLASSLRDDAVLDAALSEWAPRWRARLADGGGTSEDVADAMDAVNPVYISRNHLVEAALSAAANGDLDPVRELIEVVTDPFIERDGLDRYAEAAPAGFTAGYQTFCGT
jgi:uncharacterized protein YdiU (UPF0061 family)